MQEYVQQLRELEEEARIGANRQADLADQEARLATLWAERYHEIREKRIRAEAVTGERSINGGVEDGEDDGGSNVITGPWIAAAVAGAATAAKALFCNSRRAMVTTSAAAMVAGGISLAVVHTPHHPHQYDTLPDRPAAAPPGVRSNPKIGPPKRRPPFLAAADSPARPRETDQPGKAGTGLVDPPIAVDPPAMDPPPTSLPSLPIQTTKPTPSDIPDCRIYAPHILHRGLICGRMTD